MRSINEAPPVEARAEECLSYRKDVFTFVLRMARDQDLAQDVVQETFVRALKGIGGFSGKSGLKTWLLAIAKNETYRAIGKRGMDAKKLDALRRRENAAPAAIDADSLDTRACLEQVKDGCLYALLACLPFSQRCAFILNVLNGLPAIEVATIIGKSENAARIAVSRARSTIKGFLCGSCERLSADPSCRCENMLGYSMKHSLIRRIEAADGLRDAKRELRVLKDEVELLKTLPEREPLSSFTLESARLGIFSKN